MSTWQDLIQTSTLGLNRARLSPEIKEDWLREIHLSEDPEIRLLELAGAFSLARKAGYLPQKVSDFGGFPTPEPETTKYISPAACFSLSRVLNGNSRELFAEMIELILRANKIIPPEYLPRLFRWAIHARIYSEKILESGGNRAIWLAGINPEWNGFLPPAETTWETGNIDERLIFLSWKRADDPEKARELLLETYKKEPVQHLVKLLTVFHHHLSPADLPLLENLENHRRKEVRLTVQQLLVKIPESQLVRRMEERLRKVVQFKGGLIRDSLEIDPPGEMSEEMANDGITGESSKGVKLGKRATILSQMVGSVSPKFWENYLEKSPKNILELVLRSDWAEALIEGFAQASINYGDAFWAEAFIQRWLSDLSDRDSKKLEVIKPVIPRMVHLVPPDNLDKMLFQSIYAIRHPEHNLNGLLILEYVRIPISPKTAILFSEKVMGLLSTFGNRIDYRFRAFVYELAKSVYCFPPEVYSRVANIWGMNPYETNWFDSYVNRALKLLEFRNRMNKEVEGGNQREDE